MKKLTMLLMIFLLTGCWNYRELTDMAIVASVGIDYNEEEDLFVVSAQIFNAKKTLNSDSGNGSLKSPVTFYSSSAKTVHEALRLIVQEAPKKLYIGQLDSIILGQKLAETHFDDALDFFFRDSESRKNFKLFIVEEYLASDVLKILTPLETTPSASLMQSLLANDTYKGSATDISFDEALSNYYNEGREITLPVIKIIGDKALGEKEEDIIGTTQKVNLIIDHNSVFKKEKLIGFLTPDETVGFNFIDNKIKYTVISFPCDSNNNYAAIEIIKVNNKLVLETENDIVAHINISGVGNLSEINCKIDLANNDNILMLQKLANEEIKKIIQSTLNVAQQKFNSDIFGFGNVLYKNKYKYWQEIKTNWDEIFPKIKTEINLDIKIKSKGSIVNSTKEG